MSNYLAIATVTEALRATLNDAVKVVGGAKATAVRTDQVPANFIGVNVYLYQVSPNGSLRNDDLPSRAGDGTLVQRPRAAIDLHYLLTLHGSEVVFEPQRVLGVVVRALHEAPVLAKKAITDAAAVAALAGSDLPNAIERVRFTPLPLSLEELSKLWSVFFQAKYVLSVAYQAALVVIEGSDTPQVALPVRTRNVAVLPSLGPFIDRIQSQAPAPGSPVLELRPIHINDVLHIIGRGFRGGTTKVRIASELVDPTTLRDDLITVELKVPPFSAAALQAGVKTAQVVQLIDFPPTGLHSGFESNVVPFMLSPRVINPPPSFIAGKVSVTVEPGVAKGQRMVLMLNQTPPPAAGRAKAYTFSAVAAANAATQSIEVNDVSSPFDYLVRLQVDGAESPLDVGPDDRYTGTPKVTI